MSNILALTDPVFFRRYVEPPFHAEETIDALFPIITSGHGSAEAVDAAWTLWLRFDDRSRMYFAQWASQAAYRNEVHPAVWSKILTETWLRGKSGGLLSPKRGFRYYQLNKMFEFAAPQHLMDAEELAVFEALPEKVTVYRGTAAVTAGKARRGMSWTRDPGWAAWFANRATSFYNAEPLVLQGVALKADIFAYYSQEDEIVVRSGRVSAVAPIPVKRDDVPHQDRASLLLPSSGGRLEKAAA